MSRTRQSVAQVLENTRDWCYNQTLQLLFLGDFLLVQMQDSRVVLLSDPGGDPDFVAVLVYRKQKQKITYDRLSQKNRQMKSLGTQHKI